MSQTAPATPPDGTVDTEALLRPVRRPRWQESVIAVAVVAALVWGAVGAELSPSNFVRSFPYIVGFLARMWPPSWGILPELIQPALETIQIAIIGTALGFVLSLLVSFLAAANTSPSRGVYQIVRLLLNVMRAVPELVWALFFVAALGLGPFPGALALGFAAVGTFGKLFAESVESIDPGPLEGLTAVGARGTQVIAYGVVPQALPMIASYGLLMWEGNIRHATILGMVGAGGIGFELTTQMRLFQYRDLSMTILVVVILVTVLDRLSALVRSRII